MTRTAIGLGSNIEHRLSHLQSAVRALAELGDISAVSSLYETAPVGGPRQGAYLNAVVLLETDLTARQLFTALQAIEQQAGRTREVHWGARTLDLDLLLFDGERQDSSDLIVPHPRIGERRFVLEPLAQVWPDAPTPGSPPATLLGALPAQKLRLIAYEWVTGTPRLVDRGEAWVMAQGVLLLLWLVTVIVTGSLPPLASWWLWLGLAVAGAGAALAVSAVRSLGGSLSPLPAPLPEADLVEVGPYSLVRHPIYTSIIVTLMGTSLAVGSWPGLMVAVLLLVFFVAKSMSEERQLRLVYPGYGQYQARVRHRLLPGLW